MNHPHVDDFPLDHWHSVAFASTTGPIQQRHRYGPAAVPTRLPPTLKPKSKWDGSVVARNVRWDARLRALYRHPNVLDRPAVCAWCKATTTRTVLHVYDEHTLALRAVPLCATELARLSGLLGVRPLQFLGTVNVGAALVPVRRSDVVEELTAAPVRPVPPATLEAAILPLLGPDGGAARWAALPNGASLKLMWETRHLAPSDAARASTLGTVLAALRGDAATRT
jgi:hypothetical protein